MSNTNALKRRLPQRRDNEIETPRKVVVRANEENRKKHVVKEPEFTTWLSPEDIRSLPPLPVVGDYTLRSRLWENGDLVDRRIRRAERSDVHKPQSWKTLERLGDTMITMIAQQELSRIFGDRNHSMIGLVSDHANSNKLFAAVAGHYKLETRVQFPPRFNKRLADIFEAWVGCHVIETRLYNENDPMCELRHFLYRLWSIRYRKLMVYVYNPSIRRQLSSDEIEETSRVKIMWPNDALLRENISLPLDSQGLEIGYLVTHKLKNQGPPLQDFVLSEAEADQVTRRRIWNERTSTFHVASNPDRSTRGPLPVLASLFQQYRNKCDLAMQKIFIRENDEETRKVCTKAVIDELGCWVDELKNLTPDTEKQKVIAMLLWQQVPPPC
jgi:hypothetical protein